MVTIHTDVYPIKRGTLSREVFSRVFRENPELSSATQRKVRDADFSLQSTEFFAVSVHREAGCWARSEQ